MNRNGLQTLREKKERKKALSIKEAIGHNGFISG